MTSPGVEAGTQNKKAACGVLGSRVSSAAAGVVRQESAQPRGWGPRRPGLGLGVSSRLPLCKQQTPVRPADSCGGAVGIPLPHRDLGAGHGPGIPRSPGTVRVPGLARPVPKWRTCQRPPRHRGGDRPFCSAESSERRQYNLNPALCPAD